MEKVITNNLDKFAHFTGTDHYYSVGFGIKATDGVYEIAEEYGAHWFLDVIKSYQFSAKVRSEEFQVWKLERIKGSKFRVTCEDGNDNVVAKQIIQYSDYKDDQVTFWLEYGVIMLPSER